MKSSLRVFLLLYLLGVMSSCYHYRLSTKALPASEPQRVVAHAYLWGLLQKPLFISTPPCDNMGVNGVSEVYVHTNLGYALITVATLGIWSPLVMEYRCSKPCQPGGNDSL